MRCNLLGFMHRFCQLMVENTLKIRFYVIAVLCDELSPRRRQPSREGEETCANRTARRHQSQDHLY